jgi:partitioning defective protein 6
MTHQATNKNSEIGFVEIKSKFDAEFRRFSLDGTKVSTFELFREHLGDVHQLNKTDSNKVLKNKDESNFHIFYIDPKDDDLLPITNTDNYRRALQSARPLLRLVIQRQGECEQVPILQTTSGSCYRAV